MDCPEQRFDATAVSRGKEKLFLGIIDGKGKFTTEQRKKGNTIVFVQGDYDFGIASSLKLVAGQLGHLIADAAMVVQFAVDNSMDRAFRIAEGLLATWTESIDSEPTAAKSWDDAQQEIR